MTREDIKVCCKKISPGYNEYSECDFADNVQTLAFIDTSQGQNGSRGIVFSTNHMMMNTDGTLRIIFYTNITDVRIIESFEDAFADELDIVCGNEEFRISNCSLNKTELKVLLDELCDGGLRGEGPARITLPPPKPPANTIAVTAAPSSPAVSVSAENAADLLRKAPPGIPLREVSHSEPSADDTKQQAKRSENDVQQNKERDKLTEKPQDSVQPNEEQPDDEDIIFESDTPVIFESVINRKNIFQKPAEAPQKPSAPPEDLDDFDDFNDPEERLKIQNMTPEETMSFLAQSLSEINAPVSSEPEPKPELRSEPKPEPKLILERKPAAEQKPVPVPTPEPVQRVKEASPANIKDYNPPQEAVQKPKGLTVEPVWGDIYIKASRNLRELCESNRLSMKQIETELHDKLLDSTKAFAEITADESRVPKVLIPKITELKAAAQNFDQYFQLGEDIAVRAMFFMLYQMLSYSDRIVETPETKEGLNDFFRRFGPAGIMLSMLDMRV